MDFFSVPVAPPHSPPQHHPSAAASPAAPPALNDPPPYAEMIYAAITALKKKGGSSKIAIGKHMEQTYSNLPANHSTLLSEHLHHLKNTGQLRMVKKSYKLPISNAPVPETNNNNNQDRRPRKVQAQAQPISYAIGEANAVVPVRKSKSTRPVGRPRKQPFVTLHPSAAASPAPPAAPVAPSALDHPPPYAEMIYAAITALKEKGGSSKIAIGKHMEQTYSDLPANHSTLLTEHLHHLKNTGRLHMVKRSYKLPKSNASVPETNNNQDNAEANAAVPVRRSKRRPGKVLISDPFGEANAAVPVKNVGSSRGRGRSKRTGSPVGNSKKDEVVRQREVTCPSEELQQVRDDRDRQVLQVLALTAELQQVRDDRDRQVLQVHALTVELAAANEKLKMYECRFLEEEALRIKMHNDMMELKGNIRVFCRVRPLLPKEGVGHHESPISYPTSTEYRGRGIDVLENGETHNFAFNKVFSPTASQQDVFGEVSGLVQSVMDGYKVCIFAYGQTGSGKTYTMLGRPEALEQKGLIPRSLEQIFQLSHSTPGWKYRIQASMFEIYNGKIYDLLYPSTDSVSVQKQGLKVLLDAKKVAQVVGLTISDVGSIDEVFLLLKRATQVRSVGKTQMNEQSSRSHLVLKLQISGVNEDTKQQVKGVLNLVDLAGSERPAADASGDRLEEAKEINKSLLHLSKVINAIVMKDAHIPFRNSMLTRVLEPYLGKDSKTLMVVNISPNPSSVGESISSLRFAANANACARQVVRPPPMSVQRGASSKLKVPPCWT